MKRLGKPKKFTVMEAQETELVMNHGVHKMTTKRVKVLQLRGKSVEELDTVKRLTTCINS